MSGCVIMPPPRVPARQAAPRPPKRRGRPARVLQRLIERCCSWPLLTVERCIQSALSETDGEGLGTLGCNEAVARRMTSETGFSRFTRHDFENPLNAYYEVRPEWDTLRKERAMATNQNAINMEKVQASAERVLGLLSGEVL